MATDPFRYFRPVPQSRPVEGPKALGLTVPLALLTRTDEAIEQNCCLAAARASAGACHRDHAGRQGAQGISGNLLTNATRHNVALNVEKLKFAAPILKSFADDRKIRVGVYALKTGRVEMVA
jgi:hypothetical protein